MATINEHIANIYKDNEIEKEATIRNFLIVQEESTRDVSRNVAHYITEEKHYSKNIEKDKIRFSNY